MADHPKVIRMKRGGKYRRCFMVQPYLRLQSKLAHMGDVYRCVLMERDDGFT